jgi:hypothetical protein
MDLKGYKMNKTLVALALLSLTFACHEADDEVTDTDSASDTDTSVDTDTQPPADTDTETPVDTDTDQSPT